MSYQPKTGEPCHCRPGIERDNCPDCEGTGQRIDFAKVRAAVKGSTKQDKIEAHTAAVAKLLRTQLKPLGLKSMQQNYKGTGAQRGARQMWCRFKDGAAIDVWLGYRKPRIGSVVSYQPAKGAGTMIPHYDITDDYTDAATIAEALVEAIGRWLRGDDAVRE